MRFIGGDKPRLTPASHEAANEALAKSLTLSAPPVALAVMRPVLVVHYELEPLRVFLEIIVALSESEPR
jgi:hypothetical protein